MPRLGSPDYNCNTDVLIVDGGHPKFRAMVESTPGWMTFVRIMEECLVNYDKDTMTLDQKAEWKTEVIIRFHLETDGGWFFWKRGTMNTGLVAERLTCNDLIRFFKRAGETQPARMWMLQEKVLAMLEMKVNPDSGDSREPPAVTSRGTYPFE